MSFEEKIIIVDIDDLLLDTENPRFPLDYLSEKYNNISQKDIIFHLFRNNDIVTLANDINNAGGLHTPEMVVCCKNDNEEYIVLEGNRRICVCKLLLDRALIPNEYAKNFPFVKDITRSNINKISITVYPDRRSADMYIIDKHVRGNEKWSAIAKNAHYMKLFLEYNKDIEKLSQITREKKSDLINIITKYQFFMNVYNILRNDGNNELDITKIDYLPMTDVMMPVIVGKNDKVGLNLEIDNLEYRYICPDEKKEIYNNILILIGEAFLVRKEKKYCKNEEMPRIVSTGLKNQSKLEKLITDDIEIKGLYDLIKKFKGVNNKLKNIEDNPEKKEISAKDNEVDLEHKNNKSDNKNETTATTEEQKKSDFISNSKDKLIYIDASEDYIISYSSIVINLINQINKLYVQKTNYNEVIACSMRAIFEISVHEIKKNKISNSISNIRTNGLENEVKNIINYVKDTNNKIVEKIVANSKCHKNFGNILDVSNFEKNIRAAHLGAHSSSTNLTTENIKDLGQHVGRFVLITNELLNNKNINA